MMRLDLTVFGGRGGDSTSARWMDGFFKSAKKGMDRDSADEYDLDAARAIYRRLAKATDVNKVTPRDGFEPTIEGRVIRAWLKTSKVAKYDSETGKLTIEPGKLTQARREFENFIKNKFWKYYQKGKPKANRTPHVKK